MTVNVRPKMTVKMRARAECESHSLTPVTVRDTSTVIDEPQERGGTNKGPTPTETAIAALIGCTNTIGNKCADKLGIAVGHFTIDAVCTFDRHGVTLAEEIDVPFQRIELKIECSEPVSQGDLDRLAAEVAKFCPLSKLFRQAGTEIYEEWSSKSG